MLLDHAMNEAISRDKLGCTCGFGESMPLNRRARRALKAPAGTQAVLHHPGCPALLSDRDTLPPNIRERRAR